MTDRQSVFEGDLYWLRDALQGIFAIESVTPGAKGGRAVRVEGHFLLESSKAYERLAPIFRGRGHTLLFRREGDDAILYVVDGIIRPAPNRKWLPILLAVLTVLSMLFAYVFFWEIPDPSLSSVLRNLPKGIPFTVSLLSILVGHELGHYFMARHYGVTVTLPHLIPFPISPFGTMGAVIRMKSIPPNRRALLRIGAAGPIAGLVLAVPILILGLSLSPVAPLPREGGYIMEGSSLLYMLIKRLVFGRWIPSRGMDVMLHPVAFAGWAGLLVTSLNLIPAGQLDGGHVLYALIGDKARYANWVIIGLLVILGIFWQGWLLWAALIFVFSRSRVKPLDDVSPITGRDRAIAIVVLLLFVLIFMPLPLRFVT
ncbi:MAG: site-2 protease family protein [Chloroflexota bacterium]|nr:site-2 protease family protein [Chloroflexota bacterium]